MNDFSIPIEVDDVNISPISATASIKGSHIRSSSTREHSVVYIDQTECPVCCNEVPLNAIKQMPCCRTKICSSCLISHTTTNIRNAKAKVECPACSEVMNSSAILYNTEIPVAVRERYQEILAQDLAEKSNNHIKLCPHCNFITILDENHPIINRKKSRNLPPEWICCEQCTKEWCWSCYSPLHPGVTCSQYKKVHSNIDVWAKIRRSDNQQRNAQRCPKCLIYIEKIDGCDHMSCSKCNAKFCYRCGGRMRLPTYIGHDAKYSIFGCKYKLWPNRPILRWFVRGSIVFGILILIPIALAVILALVAVAIPLILVIALFGLPIFACLRLKKRS